MTGSYLDNRTIPPSLICSDARLLVENGYNVPWLEDLSRKWQPSLDLSLQRTPK